MRSGVIIDLRHRLLWGGTYPAQYNNALFFADHSRNCIWVAPAGGNGLPNFGQVQAIVQAAANPVGLEVGPGGDIFYVDYDSGSIHRLTYSATNHPPTGVIQASPTSGNPPLTVNFDATGSTDPDPGDTLTYSWDLDGDGSYGDAVLATATRTYTTAGTFTVGLKVTDSRGATDTRTVQINVGGSAPTPVIDTPSSSLTWAVGDPISFSGHATDSGGNAIPASKLVWTFVLHHCPGSCHTHIVQTISAVASGTFAAPDHDYPSYLEIQLTATDSANRSATTSVNVQPKTTTLTVNSVPTGLSIGIGTGTPAPTPVSSTVIVKSNQSVTAPPTQTMGGSTYTFVSWSDGGAAIHNVTVPAGGTTLTATYTSGGGSTTAYLSDLAYTVVANGWGPPEKDHSNGEQGAADGGPITLNGTVYAKGIGAHAASDIRYAMNGTCTSFTTKVGLDDEVGSNGSLLFQIFADGTKLFDSGVMTGASATQTATVDVTGKTTLQLVLALNGTADSDHGDWADAKLTCGGGGSDTTPPTVTGRSPAAGATGVATSVRPTVTFSEAIDPTTVTTTNLTLTPSGGSAVAATVAYDGPSLTATLTPTAALTAGTVYTVRVKGGTTGIADLAGNRLAADATSTFTTASGGGSTTAYLSDLAYTVVANGWGPPEKDHSNGEQGAADGGPITLNGTVYAKGIGAHAASDIRYAMNGTCTSFTTKVGLDDEVGSNGSLLFQIFADGTKLFDSGVMTGASATQTATVDVTGKTTLQLVLALNGTADSDHGDWADAKLTCGGGGSDTTPPTVTGRSPAAGATGVATSVRPTVTFSEAIDPTTVTTTNLTLTPSGGSAVAATVAYDGPSLTATLTPTAALTAGTVYTVRVKGGTTGIADLAGNRLVADATSTFTTASGGGSGSGQFLAPVTYATSPEPHSVVIADVNADGKKDLVEVNAGNNTAGVFLGNGNGTFGPIATFGTGLKPKSVVVGDLDGDGKMDLVVANQDDSTLSVLLGTGTGAFGTQTKFATCSRPHEVALGDFNHDGKVDVAAACWDGSVISVHLGNGNGTFQAATNITCGLAPHSLVIADFNRDGNLDLAVANHDANTMSVVLGNGNGTFASSVTYSTGVGTHAVRTADVNGDGILDLAAVNDGSNSVSVFLGTGTGAFGTGTQYAVGSVPKSVAMTDLNGDGKVDLVVSNTAGNGDGVTGNPGGDNVSVLFGNGNGTFQTAKTDIVGPTPFSVTAGDLDGNGTPDLATANWDGPSVSVLLNVRTSDAAPTVTGRSPAAGATGVATSVRPTVTFSEAIDPTTVTTTNLTLTPSGGSAVAATVAYDGPSLTATLTPTAALTAGTVYTVRVKGGTTGIADLAGNRLAADATSTFTTASGGGSTTAYLSDLAYTVVANGWGPPEKDHSNGEQGAADGGPITLNGTVYAKGIGAHAASDIRYAMNGTCTSFTTKVGLDDEVGSNGSLLFQIFADGTKLFDSGVMTGASATQTATVDVTGKTTLRSSSPSTALPTPTTATGPTPS